MAFDGYGRQVRRDYYTWNNPNSPDRKAIERFLALALPEDHAKALNAMLDLKPSEMERMQPRQASKADSDR
jgi:hypothetical protein